MTSEFGGSPSGPQGTEHDAWVDHDGDPERVLGDFRILREVGRGGMGIVYEATQISLQRRVALKILPFAAVFDQRRLERFQKEVRAAAALSHPNVTGIYSVGCEQGVHYYAMQYVEGQTLAEIIKSLPGSSLPSYGSPEFFRSVAELGVQAAVGLAYAHEKGVIHRDVKPSNLIVDAGGHLWVTDFGIATTCGNADLTATGNSLGTLRYMSPEQISGHRDGLSRHTDIYSLGVTLYELLSLRPAFPDPEPHQLMRRISEARPEPLQQRNSVDSHRPAGHRAESHGEQTGGSVRHRGGAGRRPAAVPPARANAGQTLNSPAASAKLALPPSNRRDPLRDYRDCPGSLGLAVRLAGLPRATSPTAVRRDRTPARLGNDPWLCRKGGRRSARKTCQGRSGEPVDLGAGRRRLPAIPRGPGRGPRGRSANRARTSRDRCDSVAPSDSVTKPLAELDKAIQLAEQLSVGAPADVRLRRERADCYDQRAHVLSDMGRLPEARNTYHQAVEIREALVRQEPNDANYQSDLARRSTTWRLRSSRTSNGKRPPTS